MDEPTELAIKEFIAKVPNNMIWLEPFCLAAVLVMIISQTAMQILPDGTSIAKVA